MSNVGDDDPGHRYRFKPLLDRPVVEVMEDSAPELGGASSLEFLRAVYADAAQPMHRRMRAAIAALPFEHPKLAVTATINAEGFAAQLEAARSRSAKIFELRAEPQLVPEIPILGDA
jgi:hypothetical protein